MACNFRLVSATYNHNVTSFYMYTRPGLGGGKALQNTEIVPTGAQQ